MKFLLFAFYLNFAFTITKNTHMANSNFSLRNIHEQPACNEDKLIMYLADIQVVNPENIIDLCIKNNLKQLCNKLCQSLQTIDTYLKTCDPPQQKDLYMQLIRGVHSLHKKVCIEESFKKDFQHHLRCFKDLHNDYRDCMGPVDWTENADNVEVCRVFQELTNCYYVKTAKLCGNTAAKLIKELIVDVINSILTITCNVSQSPLVKDAMPEVMKGCSNTIYVVYYNLLIVIQMMIL